MINIPERITPPLSSRTVKSLNKRIDQPLTRATIFDLNKKKTEQSSSHPGMQQSVQSAQAVQTVQSQATAIEKMTIPPLRNQLRKGQKTSLNLQMNQKVQICFGWNVNDARCDIDASAFLVGANRKVPDDSWFVFYGQPESPDGSVSFGEDPAKTDRQIMQIDLSRLHPSIQRIIFVMTINESYERNLNFSMIQDAYVRLLDADTRQEIVSYCMDEYYSNVNSMTIGELYLHNGQWKFNPVGNGVHQDLAGQCAIYGVEIE